MAIGDISDEEVVELLYEHLEEDGRVKMDYIKIECNLGKPVVSGRVASDDQIDIINDVVAELAEGGDFENNTWVDDTLAFEDQENEVDEAKVDDYDDSEELDSEEGFEDEEEF